MSGKGSVVGSKLWSTNSRIGLFPRFLCMVFANGGHGGAWFGMRTMVVWASSMEIRQPCILDAPKITVSSSPVVVCLSVMGSLVAVSFEKSVPECLSHAEYFNLFLWWGNSSFRTARLSYSVLLDCIWGVCRNGDLDHWQVQRAVLLLNTNTKMATAKQRAIHSTSTTIGSFFGTFSIHIYRSTRPTSANLLLP